MPWPADPRAPKPGEITPKHCVDCGDEYKTWRGGSDTHCFACRTKIEDAGKYVYDSISEFINTVVLIDFL